MPPDHESASAELLPLFPPIEPFEAGWLELDPPHRMYYEQSGNPAGVAVVFLHGGPGAGASAVHRQFFDPRFYRIVVFDQRGAGRSTPLGCLDNNTTPHLVADMEVLRRKLGIDKWVVFGGSWGSTLALAYAEHHPERCLGLVLRGIFLCRQSEIDWFLYGVRNVFPEAWRAFSGYVPEESVGPPGSLPQAPGPPRPGGAHAGGSLLEHLRGLLLDAASEPGARGRLRLRSRGPRARAHRGALLPPRHLPSG
jgi:pimeloyl-ACP methyl ester carboxylesterase